MGKPSKSSEGNERETLNMFYDKIHRATIEKEEWIETSAEIMKHFNRNGLGKAKYFIFQNVKVCEFGQSEKIQEELDVQLGQSLYGNKEGVVNLGVEAKHRIEKGMT
jgi:hypothetical protein